MADLPRNVLSVTHADTLWHRMDARAKLVTTAISALSVVSLSTLAGVASAWISVLALLLLCRIPWRWLAMRLGSVLAFLVAFVMLLPFVSGGERVILGPLSLSREGLYWAGLITFKALSALGLGLFLVATTPGGRLFAAAHALGLPGLLTHLLVLSYHYVRLLADEWHKLRIALRLRGFRNRFSWHAYATVGMLLGSLLVRSYERAQRLEQSLRSRGFDGCYRSLDRLRLGAHDPFLIVGAIVLLVLIPWALEIYSRLAGSALPGL